MTDSHDEPTGPPLRAADVARAAIAAYDAGRWEDLARLIHPEAEFELVAAGESPVRGREAIVETMRRAREDTLYYAGISDVSDLTETTALAHGRARYPLPGGQGHADATFTWEIEARDGLLWRVRIGR